MSRVELDLQRVSVSVHGSQDMTARRFNATDQSLHHITAQVAEVHGTLTQGNMEMGGAIAAIESDIASILSTLRPGNDTGIASRHRIHDQFGSEAATFVMQRTPPPCPMNCTCKCHKQGSASNRLGLRTLLGTLFVGYNGTPTGSSSCISQQCGRQGHFQLEATYVFPTCFPHGCCSTRCT